MLTLGCHEVVKRFQVADSQGIPRGLGVEKHFICLIWVLQMSVDTISQIQANRYKYTHIQIHIKVYFPNTPVLPVSFLRQLSFGVLSLFKIILF